MINPELEADLQLKFESMLSPRRPLSALSTALGGLDAAHQTFTQHWIKVVAKSNLELAYHFATLAGQALPQLKTRGTRAWILDALRVYDREGLYPAIKQLDALHSFAAKQRQRAYRVDFSEVQSHLALYLQGLSGRPLKLAIGDYAHTDTDGLFLPAHISQFPDRNKNRGLYKAQAVFLWAQTRFGTYKRSDMDAPRLRERLAAYPEPKVAESQFLRLESIRLMAVLQRELPGLHREMTTLSPQALPADASWRVFQQQLESPEATVDTTFEVLDDILRLGLAVPMAYLFESRMALEQSDVVMQARQQQELSNLAQQLQELQDKDLAEDAAANPDALQNDGEVAPILKNLSPQMQTLVDSLLQDFDTLPETNENNHDNDSGQPVPGEEAPTPDTDQHAGEVSYFDEWDHIRQNYRDKWCRVIERDIPSPETDFRARVIAKYPHLVKAIHRIFDGIRDQPVLLKKQADGEDIDIDAVISAAVDRRSGQEISDRLYLRKNHHERSIAVFILVDVSGSTKGWINEAERESLILICEALDRLDDRYALYAFSGMTHERCEIFPLKGFAQSNDVEVQARVGGLAPRYYTRMGAAMRYASKALAEEVAKHRILLVLSDGKPDDYDGYKGEYGIEDSRKALIEARAKGIRPFCITIDSEAQDYLPHLFGENGFTLLDEVGKLPLKIADIYRRLSAGA